MRITASPAPPSLRRSAPGFSPLEEGLDAQADRLVSNSQAGADAARSSYRREQLSQIGTSAAVGAGIGFFLLDQAYALPHGALIGPVFGALAGAYTAWSKLHREGTGGIAVAVDGDISRRAFTGDAAHTAIPANEARFQVLAEQGKAPNIGNAAMPSVEASREQLAAWKDAAASLRSLAGERRLVADLSNRSRDGQPALNLVDGVTAARLAATGRDVYLVSAGPAQDVAHSMQRHTINRSGSKAYAEHFRYNERTVDFTLAPLKRPEQLAEVQPAVGVPEGMFGVPKDATRYSEVVDTGALHARGFTDSPEFGTRAIKHSDTEVWSSTERAHAAAIDLPSGLITKTTANLPALGALLGTATGLMVSLALTGPNVPGPAAMAATVGFLGGRSVGRFLVDRKRL